MSNFMRISHAVLRGRNRIISTRSLYSFNDNPKLKKLKERQAFFQQDDGVPVYLKGGSRDQMLFRATLGLMGIGFIMCFEFIFRNIKKI